MTTRMTLASLVLALVLSLGTVIYQAQGDPTCSSSTSAGAFSASASISTGINNSDLYNQTTIYEGTANVYAGSGGSTNGGPYSVWAKVEVNWGVETHTSSTPTWSVGIGGSSSDGSWSAGGSMQGGGSTTTTQALKRIRSTKSQGASTSKSGWPTSDKYSNASGNCGSASDSSSSEYTWQWLWG